MMNNQRGSVLLMCFYIIGALAMIGAAFGLVMVNERLTLVHNTQSAQALYLAEAGVQKAVYDLRQDFISNANWSDGNINGINVVPQAGQFYPLYANISLGAGMYSVDIMNDGAAVNTVWVRSTGIVGKTQKTIKVYVKAATVLPAGLVLSQTGWQVINS